MTQGRRRVLSALAACGALGAIGLAWWRSRPGPVLPAPQPTRRPWQPQGGRVVGAAWDLVGIVGTGQSLAVGVEGTPVLSSKPAFGNLKLALGGAAVPPFDPAARELALVPLSEPIRPPGRRYPEGYPGNIRGETPHSAMAHQISTLARARLGRDCVTVHSVVGESGQAMAVIGRDATPRVESGLAWAAGLFEVQAIARLAAAAGKSYGVGAVVLTHGESDAERKSYAAELLRLWQDYNADLSALTGQRQTLPLLLTQQHSTPMLAGSISESALAAWRVATEQAGDVVCVGPKYQYRYAEDQVHLTALSYARLGEKYGQVFFQHVLLDQPFRPLQPLGVERQASQLLVRFFVPVPPLTWDESLPLPHQDALREWHQGRGFEVVSRGERVPIVGVRLLGPDLVGIELAADAPRELELRYALAAG
ncbi:MAG TPA: sialate O-acetylesterase, partial [Polyangiaceae bacterium]